MGYTNCSQQPIILSRILGHHELIFNERKEKSTHFDKNAAGKWTLSSNCWICEKFRYSMIVYNRDLASKHYVEITDPRIIADLRAHYKLKDEDSVLIENTEAPRIMGKITDHVVACMSPIALFNLLLDNESLTIQY